MLNLFSISWLALFAYSISRLMLGGIFLFICRRHLTQFAAISKNLKLPLVQNGRITLGAIIVVELAIGTLLLIGLFTQLAALLSISLCIKTLIWYNRFPTGSVPERITYLLLLTMSISLFITGAGFFAFDLPI